MTSIKSKISTTASKLCAGFALFGFALAFAGQASAQIVCNRTLTADIVAFDMPLMWNRFGAQNINGMMFALRRDVINLDTNLPLTAGGAAVPGRVALRPDKRPRPLVLRMAAGDCLSYTLTNLLTPLANPFNAPVPNPPPPVAGEVRSGIPFNLNIDDQVADRRVSLRFQGTQLVIDINDDGSFVGNNASSLVPQGGSRTFTIHAPPGTEAPQVGTSYGATIGGEGLAGMTANGLHAVLNVGPKDAAFYRSQLTREEMDLATTGFTANGQPIIDYEKLYPNVEPWISEGKAGLPIINMVDVAAGNEIVHSDINAIVAHGGADLVLDGNGHFDAETYPLESVGLRNPTVPNRLEPFREFTIAFHDEVATKQAFPLWFEDPILRHTLHGVRDSFMINFGSGGIGTEIIASRLRVGPPHDCVNCAYEEFFLTAFTVSDVGQLVDIPANFALELCDPALNNCAATGPKANFALFPDDPSNVHHSYTGDFVKFRNTHAGPGEQHVFHLHNHQWLFNANDDNSNYLDAQGIGPGAGYTYEINFGGSGNRNKTSGDAIFHCHFYPHFAQGMWEMWRNHDVFEQGTELQVTADGGGAHTSFVVDGLGVGDGTPAAGARALPDAEIIAGTPIPALVPLPGKAMAPMPVAGVTTVANANQVCVGDFPNFGLAAPLSLDPFACPAGFNPRNTGSLAQVPRVADPVFGLQNPGYPFWIAGIEHSVGQRPPTPPLDMITTAQAQALAGSGNGLWSHPGFADPAAIQGWDGGLPRFTADGYSAGSTAIVSVLEPRLDLSKEFVKIRPFFFPEEGTDLEQAAMAYHAQRNHASFLPDGTNPPGTNFVMNGAKPVPGAPYDEPCIDDQGDLLANGVIGDFFDARGGFDINGASPFNAVTPRVYKAANVQFDAVFNKQGYHFPQERIITLWQDVVPTVLQERPPEPFVLRNNTFDCTQYVHSNVVPKAYEVDDYQVRTPTDIIGQHIHLPKWDLTTADGAANGWNYEDGTLSPGMVVEVIEAINHFNAEALNPVLTDVNGNPVVASDGHSLTATGLLEPSLHPFFGQTQFAQEWVGARSTMQRWFFDPVVNAQDVDRGLGIIFTHDHYGPSTHQQIGLYATVLVEPSGSTWAHNETGTLMYTRVGVNPEDDGGPTSWQVAIITGADSDNLNNGLFSQYTQNVGAELVENHREFYFEYSDFQHAYQPGVFQGAGPDGFPLAEYHFEDSGIVIGGPGQTANALVMADQGALNPDPNAFRDAIQPSFRQQAPLVNGFPVDIWIFPPVCPVAPNPEAVIPNPAAPPRPCPEAISADDPGMYVVNYRNESLVSRVFDPNKAGPDGRNGTQADGDRGDLAFAMQSRTDRAIPALNTVQGLAPPGYFDGVCTGGVFCPPINQVNALNPGDPFTPMMRSFDGDRVHVKMQAGAHEEEHDFMMHGLKWLQAGSGFGESKNSGWRNAQSGGISEQFSLRTPVFGDVQQAGQRADYAYTSNASLDGWVNGNWGVLRNYGNNQPNLFPLPNNDANAGQRAIANAGDFVGVCPRAPGPGQPTPANLRQFEVVAVLAEDVLPAPAGVIVQDLFPGAHEGRAPNGGTLVYNSRPDAVAAPIGDGDGGGGRGGVGPLHDPTAILYFEAADLVFAPGTSTVFGDPVGLQAGAAVEPFVLRANAGDCIDITLHNALPPDMPDLATGNAIAGIQRRDRDDPQGMTTFQSNLMIPSAVAGLHGALVEYDVTRSDGTVVGLNNPGQQIARPGERETYRWYAGHLQQRPVPGGTGQCPGNPNNPPQGQRCVEIVATPVEFGGFNLMAADKVEQGQKAMLGAGVIYPEGSAFTVDAGSNTAATVTAPGGTFRDFTTVGQKGATVFYADSFPVHNILGEGDFGVAEDSQDMGHMAINYGTEPAWFRFGVNPVDASGNAGAAGTLGAVANAGDLYSNALVGEDPQTAVFTVAAGTPFRQHVLMPFSPGRGSTFDLHGHVWQRDPYVCEGSADLGLPGKCDMGNGHAGVNGTGEVGSQNLGVNPIGFAMGGIESWFGGQHYEVFIPSAGGDNGVQGDYLFRDHMGLGNSQGLWGIVRVE